MERRCKLRAMVGVICDFVGRAPVTEPVVELRRGNGPGHVVALGLVAAQACQFGVGDVGLDAFGDHTQAEAVGLVDGGGDQGRGRSELQQGADQVSQHADHSTENEDGPASGNLRTARLLVSGQFVLIGILVLLPGRHDWPVPAALKVACIIATVVGLAVMIIGATNRTTFSSNDEPGVDITRTRL
jgi:hypothetical protein